MEQLRNALSDFDRDVVDAFKRTVRTVAADIQRDAAARISAAESRANRAKAEAVDLLAGWNETEAEHDAAEAEIAALRSELEASRAREERLHGRIEQLQVMANIGAEEKAESRATAMPVPSNESDPAPLIGDISRDMQGLGTALPTSTSIASPPLPTATSADGEALAKPDDEGLIR
ncbi:hypothetical protein [Blastomonas fulva]|uniref:hypothetical protein n=1 Tax=Blastomonas fulva TaxID=1550728 RepID=UPI0025A475F0|nr:hypothetical protein [Blastomonas fulva]MDM7929826.1 hypothetical protein [Blastomonas fulva]MDM7967477.1 hypothetical protein [Blastomonas fulva]